MSNSTFAASSSPPADAEELAADNDKPLTIGKDPSCTPAPKVAPPDVYIGTAGYCYPHWRGHGSQFYPKNVTQKNELRHYSGVFPIVEINASFHGVPRLETLRNWCQQVKFGFKFCFKVPQTITHEKRLKDIDDSLTFFLQRLYDGMILKSDDILP